MQRFLSEFRGGDGSRLDTIIMFLTANVFRGNKETTADLLQEVLTDVVRLIRTEELFAQDHLVHRSFSTTSDVKWRLHLMGTLMQLMNVVSVLIELKIV